MYKTYVFSFCDFGIDEFIFSSIFAAILFTKLRDQILSPLKSDLGLKPAFLDQQLGLPFYMISLPLAFLFMSVVLVLEFVVPWYTEYPVDQFDYFPSLFATAWPPYFSGMCIGFLQIPLIFVIQKPLGCSTGFEKIGCFFHSKISKPNSSYIQQNTKISFDNIYQILFLVGATLGALISSVASGSYRAAPSISIVQAFIGG